MSISVPSVLAFGWYISHIWDFKVLSFLVIRKKNRLAYVLHSSCPSLFPSSSSLPKRSVPFLCQLCRKSSSRYAGGCPAPTAWGLCMTRKMVQTTEGWIISTSLISASQHSFLLSLSVQWAVYFCKRFHHPALSFCPADWPLEECFILKCEGRRVVRSALHGATTFALTVAPLSVLQSEVGSSVPALQTLSFLLYNEQTMLAALLKISWLCIPVLKAHINLKTTFVNPLL